MSKEFNKKSAYPLQWPPQYPRCKSREKSRFQTTLHKAMKNVEKSLELFAKDSGKEVTNIVISSNVSLGNMNPEDPGVAIYFQWDGVETCIPVDRYSKVEDNLQAIYHVLEADRTKLRHGGVDLVRATFRGYTALPETGSGVKWWEILRVDRSANFDEVRHSHRELIKQHHPDKGGDQDQFELIQRAFQQAKMILK